MLPVTLRVSSKARVESNPVQLAITRGASPHRAFARLKPGSLRGPRIRAHHWNQSVIGGIGTKSAQQKVDVMRIGYARPFSFQIGRRPETTVSSVRHGVTEITLSDGRLVRATLHVKSVKVDPTKPGAIDVSYNIIAEVMETPDTPICDIHETIQ